MYLKAFITNATIVVFDWTGGQTPPGCLSLTDLELLETIRLDRAVSEGEAEYAVDGQLHDARLALVSNCSSIRRR